MGNIKKAFKLYVIVLLALIGVLATGVFCYMKRFRQTVIPQEISQASSTVIGEVNNPAFAGLSIDVTPHSISATSPTPASWGITLDGKVLWEQPNDWLYNPQLSTTTDPKVALLTQDGPTEYLINFETGKVIGIESSVDPDNPPGILISTSPTSSLAIQTFPLGSCDAMSTITDLSLNDQPLHVIKNPIPVGCIFQYGSGPAYQADVQLRPTAISSDFSTLNFSFTVSKTDTKPAEQDFSINVNDLQVQTPPEDTTSYLLTL